MILSIGNKNGPDSNGHSDVNENILSSDVVLKGSISYKGHLVNEGRIEGDVIADGDLVVADNAVIDGAVKAQSVTIYGKMKGNVQVEGMCVLKPSAELEGDLTASRLSLEDGAIFCGRSKVVRAKTSRPEPYASSAAKPPVNRMVGA
jgi:cytoskeletal protein CcmA (bactofilin family)